MIKNWKGTKGKWELDIISGIIIGVKSKIEDSYYERIVDTILPDTDEEYEKERETIKANALLISKAPEMLEMLSIALERIEKLCVYADIKPFDCGQYKNDIKQLIKEATEL